MFNIGGKPFVNLEPYLDIKSIDNAQLELALKKHAKFIEVCYAQEQTALPPYNETDNLGKSLVLVAIDKFASKHLKSAVRRRKFADDFQFIFDWIDAQGCFEEYGRVMFFLSEPNTTGKIHRDYPEWAVHSPSDMFLWISGSPEKQIFVYDTVTDEQVLANSRAVLFDNCNYHGANNASNSVVWSLRVDGIFKKEWAGKVGIYTHFQSKIDKGS
jgi:hypothetical protein